MALVSDCEQSVCIGSNSWRFAAGEPLVTEYSVKYSPEMARDLAEAAGWRWCRRWHDPTGMPNLLNPPPAAEQARQNIRPSANMTAQHRQRSSPRPPRGDKSPTAPGETAAV